MRPQQPGLHPGVAPVEPAPQRPHRLLGLGRRVQHLGAAADAHLVDERQLRLRPPSHRLLGHQHDAVQPARPQEGADGRPVADGEGEAGGGGGRVPPLCQAAVRPGQEVGRLKY